MKIMITAASPSIDAGFDPRFGRCANFVVIETESMQWEAFANPAIDAAGGAGTQAAQFAVEKQVSAVVSGNFGPNASSALNIAGIAMYVNKTQGSIRNVAESFKTGSLTNVNTPTVKGSHSPQDQA
ncbi:MAG: NifB/NifX family molybdenum-iron cluster-binding protein [Anaerolineaceae bacterium]